MDLRRHKEDHTFKKSDNNMFTNGIWIMCYRHREMLNIMIDDSDWGSLNKTTCSKCNLYQWWKGKNIAFRLINKRGNRQQAFSKRKSSQKAFLSFLFLQVSVLFLFDSFKDFKLCQVFTDSALFLPFCAGRLENDVNRCYQDKKQKTETLLASLSQL